MVSPMLKVCLSLYTLLSSHLRSHLFVNCCIRRYSLYNFSFLSNRRTNLLPLTILLLSSLFFSLLLPSLLFLSVCLRHSGTSPSTLSCLSRPPPPPFRPSFFLVWSSLLSLFSSLMHAGKSPSTFMSLSLPPPWFLFSENRLLTTHSPSFFSSFQADLSTAHSRCDELFGCHFSTCPSTSASMSWYLMYLGLPLWHVFTKI